MRSANLAIKPVDGEGLFAEAIIQANRARCAAQSVEKALEGFSESLIEAEVTSLSSVASGASRSSEPFDPPALKT